MPISGTFVCLYFSKHKHYLTFTKVVTFLSPVNSTITKGCVFPLSGSDGFEFCLQLCRRSPELHGGDGVRSVRPSYFHWQGPSELPPLPRSAGQPFLIFLWDTSYSINTFLFFPLSNSDFATFQLRMLTNTRIWKQSENVDRVERARSADKNLTFWWAGELTIGMWDRATRMLWLMS